MTTDKQAPAPQAFSQRMSQPSSGGAECRFLLRLLVVATTFLAGLTSTAGAREHNRLTDDEIAAGWILLFDGETTYGWETSSRADWKVERGRISVRSGEQGLLYTTTQFSDYVLKVDFRCRAQTNSGIFLRTSASPKKPQTDCYELNIAPADNPFPTGSLVARQKTAAAIVADQWHTFEVKLVGDKLRVRCDGREVLNYSDPKPLGLGHIGLQINQGAVEFRNIKLKPLGLEPLLKAENLTDWKIPPTAEVEARIVEEATLQLKGGPGAIESPAQYGNFVLQLQCCSNIRGVDSGVLFRCIPGQPENGYESQIHNGCLPKNPSKPSHCGTGGLLGLQDARLLAAADSKWFSKTLVCCDNHIAVWVNGIQVCDWEDNREPHENPRQGQRRQPGTLVLQAHDATSDILFRDLRIVELPAR